MYNIEKSPSISKEQIDCYLGNIVIPIINQYNYFGPKIKYYYATQDTVGDGECGLHAVKIATNSPLDLQQLREIMVNLIEHYYTFNNIGVSDKVRITALFKLFKENITSLSTYFLHKIDEKMTADGIADETLENLSILSTDLCNIESLDDLLKKKNLIDFFIKSGLGISYMNILAECDLNKDAMVGLFNAFSHNIGLLKKYFINQIKSLAYRKSSVENSNNLSEMHDRLDQIKELEGLLKDQELLHFLVKLIADTNMGGTKSIYNNDKLFSEVKKQFAVTGKWLNIDCIKLLMIYYGYDLKQINDGIVAQYSWAIAQVLVFVKLDHLKVEIPIINIRQPNTNGFHWFYATTNPEDINITKALIQDPRILRSSKFNSHSDSENSLSDSEDGYSECYKILTEKASMSIDDAKQFKSSLDYMLYLGFTDQESSHILNKLLNPKSADHTINTIENNKNNLWNNLNEFMNFVEQIQGVKAFEATGEEYSRPILTGEDIFYIIKNAKDIMAVLKDLANSIQLFKQLVVKIAGSAENHNEIETTVLNLTFFFKASGHNIETNITKYCRVILDSWDKLTIIGFNKEEILHIIDFDEHLPHENKFKELEFIAAKAHQIFKEMMTMFKIPKKACLALFFRKQYSENMEDFMKILPKIHADIATLFKLYLQQGNGISEEDFIEIIYSHINANIIRYNNSYIAEIIPTILLEIDKQGIVSIVDTISPKKKIQLNL